MQSRNIGTGIKCRLYGEGVLRKITMEFFNENSGGFSQNSDFHIWQTLNSTAVWQRIFYGKKFLFLFFETQGRKSVFDNCWCGFSLRHFAFEAKCRDSQA